jgi:hypothetical protein
VIRSFLAELVIAIVQPDPVEWGIRHEILYREFIAWQSSPLSMHVSVVVSGLAI